MHPNALRGRFVALLLSSAPAFAAANPSDPTVVHGSADFTTVGDALEVRNDPGTIIDWGDFSVGAGELARFLQQSADSAVLNRVVGNGASEIAGTLASNGRVFLINPNGIVFGDGAVIDTAGFVASTLEMTDEDFLAGDLKFTGNGGRIVNAGMLRTRGGNVFFVAPDVENSGIIQAEDGSLTLAAGREVRIASLDEPGVEVLVQSPDDGVLNLGELIAERGAVRALAGTIEHSGAIEASSVTVDADGAIVLRAQGDVALAEGSRLDASGADGGDIDVVSDTGTVIAAGTIDASGTDGNGGRVRLLGNRVGLVGDAVVDATGSANGGEVLIGGNQEGMGPEANASRTFVGSDARVDASSADVGTGGRIIAYAEDETRVFGALRARGGPGGGDGGFIETSGGTLQVTRTPDAGATAGAPGDWLIDPDLVVIAGDAAVNSEVTPSAGGGGEDLFTGDPAGAADSLIGDQVIEDSLNGGTSVIVRTGPTADSIIVDATIDLAIATGGLSLTLDANQDIVVNAPIRNTSEVPLDLDFIFGGGATVGADLITAANFGGNIDFQPVASGSVNFVGPSVLGGSVSALGVDFVLDDPTADVFIEGPTNIDELQLDAGLITFDFLDDVGPEPTTNFVSTLQMTGGTLSGPGVVRMNTFNWFGGELAGVGTTQVLGDTIIDLRGPGDDFTADPLALRDRSLILDGSSQDWNEGDILMSGTGLLDIASPLLATFASPGLIVNEGGSPRVVVQSGSSLSTSGLGLVIETAFDNGGTFDFTNDVDLRGGGTSLGLYSFGPAATLGLGGGHQISGALAVGGVGSTLEQIDGVTTIDVSGQSLSTADLPRLDVLGGSLELLPNGTAGPIDYSTSDLVVSGGALFLDSTVLRVLSTLDWTGGTLAGARNGDIPRLQIDPTASAAWSGAAKSMDGGLFYENLGTTTWTAGDVTLNGASRITQGDQIQDGAEAFQIVNSAPVTLIDGGGTAFFEVAEGGGSLSHSGALATIEVTTSIGSSPGGIPGEVIAAGSELHLAGGGNHFGEFEVLGGLRLSGPAGSSHIFNIPSTLGLGGTGTVFFSGVAPTVVLGSYDIQGTVIDTGTFRYIGSGPALTSTLDLFEGTLDGTGTVQVDTALNWEPAGTITGGNPEIPGQAILDVAQVNMLDSGAVANPTGRILSGTRALTTSVSTSWTAGDLTIQDAAIFRTAPTSTFDISLASDASILNGGGAPNLDFDNGATIGMNSTAVATLAVPVMNNQADTTITDGTLVFTGGGFHAGQFDLADGAVVRFAGGINEIAGGTDFNAIGPGATGRAEITGGVVDILGELNIDFDNLLLDGGVLAGDGRANVLTRFDWLSGDLGAGTDFGDTILRGGATGVIGGTAARSIIGNYALRNYGSLIWSGGDLTLGSGASLFTGADPLDSLPQAASFDVALSAPGMIDGAGIFTVDAISSLTDTSTAAVTFGAVADLLGTVTAAGTDLHFTRGNTYAGGFAVDGGVLRFSDVDGTGNTLSGSLTGAGTVAFSGSGISTVATGAEYDAGATLIDTGTVAFDSADATTAALTLTDGTLAGAGSLLVTGTSTWNGTGAMIGSGTTQLDGSAQLTIEGTGTRRLGEQRTLSSAASLVWTDGDIDLDGDAAIVSSGDFLIDANGPVSMNTTGGAPLFFSSGALAKTGAGTATIGVSTALQGAGSVADGTLAFDAPTTQGAAFTVTDPGVLRFGADASLGETGSLAGDGTLEISNGTFALTGTRELALGGVAVTGGTLDAADDALVLAAALDLAGGSFTAVSITVADGAVSTLGGGSLTAGALDFGTGAATFDGATVSVDGATTVRDLTLNAGSLSSGTLAVGSALDLAGGSLTAGSVTVADGATSTLGGGSLMAGALDFGIGAATFDGATVSVDGATTVRELTLNAGSLSSGTLAVGSALDLAGGSLTAGSITVADGAVSTLGGGSLTAGALDFGTGAATFGGAMVSVEGAATVRELTLNAGSLSSGTLAVGSALDLAGGSLTAGSITVADGAVSTLGGGSLTAGALDFGTGAATFDGATVSVDGATTVRELSLNAGSLGSGTLAVGSALLAGGTVTVTDVATADGLVTLAGGALTVGELSLGGTLAGSGTITGALTNAGLVSAGASPGVIRIDGDYTQTADGRLLIELDGTTATAGSDFDLLEISGAASLDGTLEFVALDAYDPSLGDLLVPITWGSVDGSFAEVIQPTPEVVYDPVLAATGLETTLVELNGNSLGGGLGGGGSSAEEVAAQQGTTVEEIETTQEVVELGTERLRAQETCEDAVAPEEGGEDGRQGVACRSI